MTWKPPFNDTTYQPFLLLPLLHLRKYIILIYFLILLFRIVYNRLFMFFLPDSGYWRGLARAIDIELRAWHHRVPALALLPPSPSDNHLRQAFDVRSRPLIKGKKIS